MTRTVRVSRRANRQIRTGADWWAANRSKAPMAFAEEVERGFELAASFPHAGEPVWHPRVSNLRRISLGRIRYHLYYRVDDAGDAVEVLALWHSSRGSGPPL